MANSTDHDGKSQSASAVDIQHYPHPVDQMQLVPTHEEIAAHANELWVAQGKPENSAERIWLEAERELQTAAKARSLVDQVYHRSGSVQP